MGQEGEDNILVSIVLMQALVSSIEEGRETPISQM